MRFHRNVRLVLPALLAAVVGLTLSTAAAETVGGADFARDPARFVGHEVKLAKLGCFSASPTAGLRCTSYHGVYVLAGDVAPAALKAKILAECGGIVEAEDDPSCLFDATFAPTAVRKGKGAVIRGDTSIEGPVWMIEAGRVVLAVHR